MTYRDFYRAREYGSEDDDSDSDGDSDDSMDYEAHSDGSWKVTRGRRQG